MTIPANLGAENNWGSAPATVCWGPQGGPYNPANTGQGLPIQGSQTAGQSGSSINPVLTGRLDGNGDLQADNANQDVPLLVSAQRNATVSSADQSNRTGRGLMIYVNVTTASGTGGLNVCLYGKDTQESNQYFELASYGNSSPIKTTGQFAYCWYPGSTSTGTLGGTGANVLPATWRLTVVANDSSNYTYSLSASVVL
jgi:hypothetical protein